MRPHGELVRVHCNGLFFGGEKGGGRQEGKLFQEVLAECRFLGTQSEVCRVACETRHGGCCREGQAHSAVVGVAGSCWRRVTPLHGLGAAAACIVRCLLTSEGHAQWACE